MKYRPSWFWVLLLCGISLLFGMKLMACQKSKAQIRVSRTEDEIKVEDVVRVPDYSGVQSDGRLHILCPEKIIIYLDGEQINLAQWMKKVERRLVKAAFLNVGADGELWLDSLEEDINEPNKH